MARNGDPKALALVLDRLLIVAKRAAAKVLLKDPERVDIDQESQDLVQAFVLHVLERKWKLLADHKAELSPFDAYAYLVAWCFMRDEQKRKPSVHGVRTTAPQDLPEPPQAGRPRDLASVIAERELAVTAIERVLADVSPKQRELFLELMIAQRPVAEIMERFDMTEDAIYQNRKRFRDRLAEALRRLQGLGPDEPDE